MATWVLILWFLSVGCGSCKPETSCAKFGEFYPLSCESCNLVMYV
jgi:hypothetical protein